MLIRALTIVGALAGGGAMSQFPAFSDQYVQRLSGAVDEMRIVVSNFDNTLAQLGQTRAEAFAPGQDLSDREAKLLGDAKSNIDRLAFLETALAKVQSAPVLTRVVQMPMVADRQIASRAMDDFKPAVPLTVEGLACAGIGLILGWGLISGLLGLVSMLFSRRRRESTAQ
ncbi:MAG: DUF2937 family protein [Planktomarina sp.]